MQFKKPHAPVGTILTPLLCAVLFCLLLSTSAFGDDSCITCHTDEDLLEENLAEDKTKKSAMQAGSG
ncbi:hypothetical protein ACFL0S_01855 [Thermodesulfobacteriota bacterium]